MLRARPPSRGPRVCVTARPNLLRVVDPREGSLRRGRRRGRRGGRYDGWRRRRLGQAHFLHHGRDPELGADPTRLARRRRFFMRLSFTSHPLCVSMRQTPRTRQTFNTGLWLWMSATMFLIMEDIEQLPPRKVQEPRPSLAAAVRGTQNRLRSSARYVLPSFPLDRLIGST